MKSYRNSKVGRKLPWHWRHPAGAADDLRTMLLDCWRTRKTEWDSSQCTADDDRKKDRGDAEGSPAADEMMEPTLRATDAAVEKPRTSGGAAGGSGRRHRQLLLKSCWP